MPSFIQVLPKPDFGEPCNGCGLCCAEQACDIAIELGFPKSPCQILEKSTNGGFICGLLIHPYLYLPRSRAEQWQRIDAIGLESGFVGTGEESLKSYYRNVLAVGKGCDSDS